MKVETIGAVPMFDVVTLKTQYGGLLVRGRVPYFDPPMDVLQWGERLFARRDDGDYYEVAFYAVMPGWEVKVVTPEWEEPR